ncbi:response regulator [Leifsonia sp. YAF41]|uniref:response regulator n=1 Tax=Leifsonia sp. YAF41 TaxID=3233086 RepID=UPI003F961EBA
MKILIADDDPQILRALRITLGARGYEIVTADDGAAALNAAIAHHPDLVMLDLGMPNIDGIGVITALRGWSQVPILVVSGRSGAADKVDALDAGADDYVTKPFSIDELLARIRALTRRVVAPDDEPVVSFGDITVNLAAKQVTRVVANGATGEGATVNGASGQQTEAVRLTPTEWLILEELLRNPGRLVTREALLTRVWGPNHTGDSGYLRLYLAQLRKKLETDPSRPRYLLTEAGMGYRFTPDA